MYKRERLYKGKDGQVDGLVDEGGVATVERCASLWWE